MVKSLPCVLPTQGATVLGALRHPGQVTCGLLGTKQKPTLIQRDNLRKNYTINQFSSFVGDKTVMGSYNLLAFICLKMELHWRSNPVGGVARTK